MAEAAAIVPPELLVPPEAYGRGLRHDDAAIVLDHHLRRLARQECLCRLVLGRLAQRLLRIRGHHTLGFARVQDYADERLGCSAREIQTAAQVVDRVRVLPAIASAFRAGTLSWSQLRLLVAVATPADEQRWLEVARGTTVRDLAARIRETRDPVVTEEDSRATFRQRCPRHVRRLWQEGVELARRMAGAALTPAQAAETIAAEGLSARSAPPVPTAAPTRAAGAADVAPCVDVDWAAVREALPEDIEALAADVDSLNPFALDARLRTAVTAMQRIAWQTGRLLRTFADRRLHRLFGYASSDRYVRERLGLSPRRARALVAVERRTWDAPALGEAYRTGAVSWSRALTLLPIIDDRTDAAWVRRAVEVTARRLADEVEWALAVRVGWQPILPPAADAVLSPVERQMCASVGGEVVDGGVTFTGSPETVALFRTAVAAFAERGDPPWGGLERLLRHVCAEWRAQPRHRDPIFERDGWRCAVPACSARRNLHDHHVVFRSRGGSNARDNRIALCAWHHLRGIHAGRVRAWGEAPAGITWELGVRRGNPPLLRLQGDRYVS